jgi:hypothetical protein
MGEDVPKLTLTLDHDGPMPLGSFTEALSRLSGRYGRYSRTHGEADAAKLYIAEIRQGSIVIDLVSAAVAAQAVIEGAGGVNSSSLARTSLRCSGSSGLGTPTPLRSASATVMMHGRS